MEKVNMAGSEDVVVPVVDEENPAVVEDVLDLEDEELKAAEAALAADEAKEPTPTESDTENVDDDDPKPPEGEKEGTKVPVGVAIELRRKNQGLKEHIAHLQGKVAVYETSQQAGDSAPPEKTPEEQIAELHQQRIDAAEKCEDGGISVADLERIRLDAESKEREIRAQAQPQVVPVDTQPPEDLALEEYTRKLEETYPSITSATDEQIKPLEAIARQQYQAKHGVAPVGAQGTANLRTDIAILHESIYGTKQPAPAQAVTKPAELSDAAKAREQKLELAQNHPIDTSALGTQSETELVTDEQAMAKLSVMNDDDAIDFLDKNPALKQRLGVNL